MLHAVTNLCVTWQNFFAARSGAARCEAAVGEALRWQFAARSRCDVGCWRLPQPGRSTSGRSIHIPALEARTDLGNRVSLVDQESRLIGCLLFECTTMTSYQTAPLNRCGYCCSPNYRRVVKRDAQGAMRCGQRLDCFACTREFADRRAWRQSHCDVLPMLLTTA